MYFLKHPPSQTAPDTDRPVHVVTPDTHPTGEASAAAMPQPHLVGKKAHLLALLGYFLLAVVVTYPAVRDFTTQVPGDLIADRDQNLWNLWWLRYAITHAENPFQTGLLYYPFGVSLYYHTLTIPLGVIGLLPQVIFGLPAAYNTVLLAAFTLSGYGAFRLGLLLVGDTRGEGRGIVRKPYLMPFAAFLGGVVFAFTPYTLDALKGQPEVLSLQWMPFYVEAWIRAWQTGRVRHGVIAGVFMALAALSSLYYALYLVIFSAAYLLYRLFDAARGQRLKTLKWSAFLITPVVALALTLPLAIGLVSNRGDPRLAVVASPEDNLAHSADLLSFFAPPHDHPLLGGNAYERPGVAEPAIHDYLGLGYVALALSVLGAVVAWGRRGVRFWVALAVLALVLATGPQLQIGRYLTGIPMPFALLQALPGFDAIAKPERMVVLARLCMGLLATWGAAWVLSRLAGLAGLAGLVGKRAAWRRALPFAAVLALLLVELPIHPRYVQSINIPEGFSLLASQERGGLMELPFATQQNEVAGERMLYQTMHGQPIMSGYLARSYNSPIVDSCGPFWSFISARYLPIEGRDIVSPTMTSRPLDILSFYGIKYLAVYNNYNGPNSSPLDAQEKAAYDAIVARVSSALPLYQDGFVGIHRVDTVAPESIQPALMVSDGWYDVEGGSRPFRWVKGGQGRLCVFSPRPMKAALLMNAVSFAKDRAVTFSSVGGANKSTSTIYSGEATAGGTQVRTQVVQWPAGMSEVLVVPAEPGVTPRSLDPNSKDNRLLTVGIRDVRLDTTALK